MQGQKFGFEITKQSKEGERCYWFEAEYHEGAGVVEGNKMTKPEPQYWIFAKWDGCFELKELHTGDQMHFCGIDDLITMLEELKKLQTERGFE